MKNLFYVLLTLVVLLIIGALAAPYFISTETIKAQVAEQVQKSTGHQMEIGGAFRMSFFPTAGVHMENVTLYGPAGAEGRNEEGVGRTLMTAFARQLRGRSEFTDNLWGGVTAALIFPTPEGQVQQQPGHASAPGPKGNRAAA